MHTLTNTCPPQVYAQQQAASLVFLQTSVWQVQPQRAYMQISAGQQHPQQRQQPSRSIGERDREPVRRTNPAARRLPNSATARRSEAARVAIDAIVVVANASAEQAIKKVHTTSRAFEPPDSAHTRDLNRLKLKHRNADYHCSTGLRRIASRRL